MAQNQTKLKWQISYMLELSNYINYNKIKQCLICIPSDCYRDSFD